MPLSVRKLYYHCTTCASFHPSQPSCNLPWVELSLCLLCNTDCMCRHVLWARRQEYKAAMRARPDLNGVQGIRIYPVVTVRDMEYMASRSRLIVSQQIQT